MNARMKNRLIWKLLAINMAVIATVILVVWVAIDYLAAGYFTVLMDKYHISPDEAHQVFLSTVHRYLIWGSLVALTLALLLSYGLTRRVLRPLSRMLAVTQSVATGDYSARGGIQCEDEMGRLGQAFDRMTESLSRIERLRKQMVIDAAHELRTPLTNVRGYLEALRDGVFNPTHETFEMLHGEVLRLVGLTESLLELAQADAARTDMHCEDVSLFELVTEALELGKLQIQTKNLRVQPVLAADAEHVYADPGKLRRVLRNLTENAWQYCPTGGRIVISSERVPEGVRLTFANNGTTFSGEDAIHIFERFYRADNSRSREHGGAGIGLAIVKELVEAHGGTVGAATDGAETRIWLTLPAESRKPAGRQPPFPSAPPGVA
jgi:signal transduction histidine kinase